MYIVIGLVAVGVVLVWECQKCKHCHVPTARVPSHLYQPPALYTECIYTGVTHPSTLKTINTHSIILTSSKIIIY